MQPTAIDPAMTVDEIMRRWPATIHVMIRHGMLCVGCPIGIFHTVADACAAHDVDEGAFRADLLAAMAADAGAGPSAFAAGSLPGLEAGEPDSTGGGGSRPGA